MAQVSHSEIFSPLAFPPLFNKMKRASTPSTATGGGSGACTPRTHKRVKRSIIAIKDVKVNELNPLLSRACTKNDKEIESIDFKTSVNLTDAKEKWMEAPFGIKDILINTTELPSFMGGSSTQTWLSLTLKVDEETKNRINAIDTALLGKSSFEGEVHVNAKEYEDLLIMNVRVQLANSVVQTPITVIDEEGKHDGHGWEFLAPLMERHRNFKGSICKVCVSPSFIWSVDKKKGVVWEVDRLVLKPFHKVIELEYDPFGDVE
jgi:hypothetical protein